MFAGKEFVVDNQHGKILRVHFARVITLTACRIFQRNVHDKSCADTFLRFDGYRAVHHLDDIFCNRHAETRAAVFGSGRVVFLAEGFKNSRQILFTHADTRVRHRESEIRLPVELRCAFNDQLDFAARLRELDGVAKDIYQHLLQLRVVADVILANRALKFAFVS